MVAARSNAPLVSCAVTLLLMLAGCAQGIDDIATSSIGKSSRAYTQKDRECLERAMFFESNRSSRHGLMAVGTVVMNRVASDQYPDTICGVVGQKGQFAPGVLSRPMNSKALPDVQSAADAVLRGERHPGVRNSMFFHAAGLTFPYKNMHYVLVAGGNAFYEKRSSHLVTQRTPPPPIEKIAAVAASPAQSGALAYETDGAVDDPIGAMILTESSDSGDAALTLR
jgi:hypothetical protein